MDIAGNGSGVGTAAQATIYCPAGGVNPPKVSWIGGSSRGGWASGAHRPAVTAGFVEVYNVVNINDTGALPTPSVPASGGTYTNNYSVTARVGFAVAGGTISSLTINGNGTGLIGTNPFYVVKPGETIGITYTGTVTWAWFAT
jgi:hypothetical protein